MARLMETIGGCWELFRLGMKTRWRLRGPYWRWRYETAFGADPARRPTKWSQWRSVIEYGRWVHRMRRRS
ncbi:MAG: hypothetical protein L0219_14150 [Phycisphaerales bacterium]|nr:hypothetical protein [Phycisphaerales bacterium]